MYVTEADIKIVLKGKSADKRYINFTKQTVRRELGLNKSVSNFNEKIVKEFEKVYNGVWECALWKTGGYGNC